jgi:hypothetical protein
MRRGGVVCGVDGGHRWNWIGPRWEDKVSKPTLLPGLGDTECKPALCFGKC